MPPRKAAPRKRRPPKNRAVKRVLFVAWLLPFAWLVWRAANHTPHAAEWAACLTLAALVLAWRVRIALRPKQRVMTWKKPRGIDLIRRGK